MLSTSELQKQKQAITTSLNDLKIDISDVEAKLASARNQQDQPPFVVAGLEADLGKKARKLLALSGQLNTLNGQLAAAKKRGKRNLLMTITP